MLTVERPRGPSVERLAPAGVVPLELWDLELARGILWDHMDGPALPHALAEAVARLRQGTARTRSGATIPPLARALGGVWLAGGRASAIDASALARTLALPVWIADEPCAVAERAARALVPRADALAVIDLGQSRLKLWIDGVRSEHPRPWDRLPLPTGLEPAPPARAALRAWVGPCLAQAAALAPVSPSAVVFALPCELRHATIPGPCSYAGLAGDDALVPDVIAAAGWPSARVLVINDAELAAVAAGLDPRAHGTLTLVLTLGFGVGAALCQPRAPAAPR